MYGGKLRRIKFKYTGRNVEAILDRLPAAKIMQKTEVGYILTVEVFRNVVDMWIRSKGNALEIINKQKTYSFNVVERTNLNVKYSKKQC